MKKTLLFAAILSLATMSCKSTQDAYYQVYNVTPTSSMQTVGTKMLAEDEHAACWYDLWGKGGSSAIDFQNKTNETMIVFLNRSLFWLNDYEYTLYDVDRAQTDSAWMAKHPYYVVVPPMCTAPLDGFVIHDAYYYDPKLSPNEEKGKTSRLSFDREDSPLRFGNSLCYTIGDDTTLHTIGNDFYVSQIENIREDEMFRYVHPASADGTVDSSQWMAYCPLATPHNFYVRYDPDETPYRFKAWEAAYLLALFVCVGLLITNLK